MSRSTPLPPEEIQEGHPTSTAPVVGAETWQREFQELVTLSWIALGQAEGGEGTVDDETYRFFTAVQPSGADNEHATGVHIADSPFPKSRQNNTALDSSSDLPNQKTMSPMEQPPLASEPVDSYSLPPHIPGASSPANHKRLEKLLPRPFSCSHPDTTPARKSITTCSSIPHLSAIPLYHEPTTQSLPKRWAVFTFLTAATPPTPKELFVQSVVKAISERLPVHVTLYSCYDPTISLHLPVAADECEVALFFVDGHLATALTSILETVHSFSRSSPPVEAPFGTIGSIHGRPLRSLFLHTATHEDAAIKNALWQSLKALATLTPPQ